MRHSSLKHSSGGSVPKPCAAKEKGTRMKNVPEARQNIGHDFLAFKMVIDDLPASEIKQMADDYKECIVWNLWAETISLNEEIQKILIFWDFLDSQIVPVGITAMEQVFYRRTAERLVREGFLPRYVMQQFKKTKSVRTPLNRGKEDLILSQAE